MPKPQLLDQFLNHYACPTCEFQWYDVWDCGVNMTCPRCGLRAIEPTQSIQLPKGGVDELAIWQGEFEHLTENFSLGDSSDEES